jgi:hypothetical protein
MKKVTCLSTLVLVCTAVLVAQPKIEIVGGESFDFGPLYKGEKAERKVTIKNVGTQPLVIERVQPSCGCTATILEEKNIPPGKTTSLSVGFDSRNFAGEVHKSVAVYSNDPVAPTKEIRFKVFVKEALTASPPYINFMPGRVDSTMTSSTVLKNMSEETIKILSVTANSPDIVLELKKKELAPGESVPLIATFTPSKVGYAYHDVVIKTNHPKQTELTLKLVCNVLRASTSTLPAGREGFPTTVRNK